jgi:hypothetical protein
MGFFKSIGKAIGKVGKGIVKGIGSVAKVALPIAGALLPGVGGAAAGMLGSYLNGGSGGGTASDLLNMGGAAANYFGSQSAAKNADAQQALAARLAQGQLDFNKGVYADNQGYRDSLKTSVNDSINYNNNLASRLTTMPDMNGRPAGLANIPDWQNPINEGQRASLLGFGADQLNTEATKRMDMLQNNLTRRGLGKSSVANSQMSGITDTLASELLRNQADLTKYEIDRGDTLRTESDNQAWKTADYQQGLRGEQLSREQLMAANRADLENRLYNYGNTGYNGINQAMNNSQNLASDNSAAYTNLAGQGGSSLGSLLTSAAGVFAPQAPAPVEGAKTTGGLPPAPVSNKLAAWLKRPGLKLQIGKFKLNVNR